MTNLSGLLACRLEAEDERLRRQQRLFEEHRQWLLSELVSITNTEDSAPLVEDKKTNNNNNHHHHHSDPSSYRKKSVKRSMGVPVEERLLEYGRERAERIQKARQTRQEEKELEEKELLRLAERKSHKVSHNSLPIRLDELTRLKVKRYERITEDIMEQLNFHPRISIESARLANERKVKENIESMPIAETLLYRKAISDEVMERKRAESNILNTSPMITKRAKMMKLPYSATERLYMHAKEKYNEEKDIKENFDDIKEENIEFTFNPSISEKAEKLQRKPGRKVFEDLYEHGVQQQQQKSFVSPDTKDIFHPSINRVSELIATKMNESTKERLLRPREIKRSETPSLKLQIRREDLDRRFNQLYIDGSTKASRYRSISRSEEELEAECTFAPKINRYRSSNNGISGLPLEVRMRLWQERRNKKLIIARKEATENESVITPTKLEYMKKSLNDETIKSNEVKKSNDFDVDPKFHYNSDFEIAGIQCNEQRDTIFKAMKALENAERVSQYIMTE